LERDSADGRLSGQSKGAPRYIFHGASNGRRI